MHFEVYGVMSKYLKVAAFSIFFACTSQPSADRISCQNSDWYEIGRRDGASGAPVDRLKNYEKTCNGVVDPENEVVYRNGRNAGLVEYCSTRNGYELGRMNSNYQDVCPSQMEDAFMKAYKSGGLARQSEAISRKLSDRIDDLTDRLENDKEADSDQRAELRSQIESLKEQRAEIDEQSNAPKERR
jgi:hypothetical protein